MGKNSFLLMGKNSSFFIDGNQFVFSYLFLIVSLVFSHLGFWSGSLFLIAPFPDLCLLVLLIPYLFKIYNKFFDRVEYILRHGVKVLLYQSTKREIEATLITIAV